MKDFFFLIVGIAVIAASFYAFLQKPAPERYQDPSQPSPLQGRANLNSPPAKGELEGVVLEIADTDAKRAQGLSGRESLPVGTGLLFVFDKPGLHGFWMKDMKFAIDIIWLDDNLSPIGIARGVSPETYPEVFYPPRPVKYVLETNPGEIVVIEFNP